MTMVTLPPPKESNYKWQYQGACREVDPETFFLPYNCRSEEKRAYILEAKKVCATCPVIKECLEYAVTSNQEFGVWGGLSEEELRTVRRKRARVRSRVIS